MFFKDYLNSVADCLDVKLKGFKQQKHSGDIGELCEFFIKDFLYDSFAGNLRVFRGGQVVDSCNNKSEQIDIVLCSQNSIKIFSDKGIYPIETVFGVVNIKKKLTYTNLFSTNKAHCGAIKNLQSIPKDNVKLHAGFLDRDTILDNFKKRFPYKIIFAYEGQISSSWEDELNNLAENEEILESLPDIIIVNKKGMIKKIPDGKGVFHDGEVIEKYFHFSKFEKGKMCHIPFFYILNELYKNIGWQYFISPAYEEYFNKELI